MERNIEDFMHGTSQVIEVPIVVETSVSTSSSSNSANVSTIATSSSVNTESSPSLSLTVGTNSSKESRSSPYPLTSSRKCVCRGSKYHDYYYNLSCTVLFVILSLASLYLILLHIATLTKLSFAITIIIRSDIIRKRCQIHPKVFSHSKLF